MKEYKIKINAEQIKRAIHNKKFGLDSINKSPFPLINPNIANDFSLKEFDSDFNKKLRDEYFSSNEYKKLVQDQDVVTAQSASTVCGIGTGFSQYTDWGLGGQCFNGNLIERQIGAAYQTWGKGLIVIYQSYYIPSNFLYNLVLYNFGISYKKTASDPNLQCFVDCCSFDKYAGTFSGLHTSFPYGPKINIGRNYWYPLNSYATRFRYLDYWTPESLKYFRYRYPPVFDLTTNYNMLQNCNIIYTGVSALMSSQSNFYNLITDEEIRDPNLYNPIHFEFPTPDKWEDIKSWIYNGGILVINIANTNYEKIISYANSSEYLQCEKFSPAGYALSMRNIMSDFLSLFDGSITINDGNDGFSHFSKYAPHNLLSGNIFSGQNFNPNFYSGPGGFISQNRFYLFDGYQISYAQYYVPRICVDLLKKNTAYVFSTDTSLDNFLVNGYLNGERFGPGYHDFNGDTVYDKSFYLYESYLNTAFIPLNVTGSGHIIHTVDYYDQAKGIYRLTYPY